MKKFKLRQRRVHKNKLRKAKSENLKRNHIGDFNCRILPKRLSVAKPQNTTLDIMFYTCQFIIIVVLAMSATRLTKNNNKYT